MPTQTHDCLHVHACTMPCGYGRCAKPVQEPTVTLVQWTHASLAVTASESGIVNKPLEGKQQFMVRMARLGPGDQLFIRMRFAVFAKPFRERARNSKHDHPVQKNILVRETVPSSQKGRDPSRAPFSHLRPTGILR
jgi:hypothetical protein